MFESSLGPMLFRITVFAALQIGCALHLSGQSRSASEATMLVIDVDRDLKADRVYLTPDGAWFVCNTSGFNQGRGTPSIPWGSKIPGWPADTSRLLFADFDGDLIPDRGYLDRDGKWYVTNSSGTNSGCGTPAIPWGSTIPGWPNDLSRIYIGEFDGDGISDRAYVDWDGKWYVANSVGTDSGCGTPNIPWGSSLLGWRGDRMSICIADFDGDKISDRAFLDVDGKWYFAFSAGTDLRYTSHGTAIPGWPNELSRIACVDLDSDGKSDRVYIDPEGRWYVANSSNFNSGCGTQSIAWGSKIPGFPANFDRIIFADFEGTGRIQRAFLTAENRWHVVSDSQQCGVAGLKWGAKAEDVDFVFFGGCIMRDKLTFTTLAASLSLGNATKCTLDVGRACAGGARAGGTRGCVFGGAIAALRSDACEQAAKDLIEHIKDAKERSSFRDSVQGQLDRSTGPERDRQNSAAERLEHNTSQGISPA